MAAEEVHEEQNRSSGDKWKILGISVLMLAAVGAVMLILRPRQFQSEAVIALRFAPSAGTVSIMTQRDVLSSLSVGRAVAAAVGPEKILAQFDGGNDLNLAAVVVMRKLTMEPQRGRYNLELTFTHPDEKLVQPVLNEVIQAYADLIKSSSPALGSSTPLQGMSIVQPPSPPHPAPDKFSVLGLP